MRAPRVERPLSDGTGPLRGSTTAFCTLWPTMADHPMSERLDGLSERREAAVHAGSERAVQRQRDKGKMLARERIDYLLDPGSFHELDMLARHRAHESGIEERPYTDGVITRMGDHRRPEGLSVFPGLHSVRRGPR